jgi:PEP-CTERM motif
MYVQIVTPEPSTGLLVIAGLLGFAGRRRARA